MEFRRMTPREMPHWYYDELCTAFLPQECKPLPDILVLEDQGYYEVWGLFEVDTLLGYAALWKAPSFPLVLLDYLGVTTSRRSSGLGSEILSRLKQQGRPLILESELPIDGDKEEKNRIRRRRIDFYRRNGFFPVYHMATCGLAWQALLYDPTKANQEDIMRWHRSIYGPRRTDVRIPLPDGDIPQMPYWVQ